MSNVDPAPAEVRCGGESPPARPGGVEVIEAREVPLGGPRAMSVRRTLPSRGRTMIGAWCFVDHYGPDRVEDSGGMVVPPHPHTGLQTVSWLFTGWLAHRDSVGTHATVAPGELNLMTAGRGIAHSEVSTPPTTVLHGVQLWVALPEEARHAPPAFEHWVPPLHQVPGGTVAVLVGSVGVAGRQGPLCSPVTMHSRILGAEVTLAPGGSLDLALDPRDEHGVLVDTGPLLVQDQQVERGQLAYLTTGQGELRLSAGEGGARVLLLGGEPFGERIVMWWNFIGRDHDEIVAYRDAYQAEIEGRRSAGEPVARFGSVDYPGAALPAPVLPGVRLRPRR